MDFLSTPSKVLAIILCIATTLLYLRHKINYWNNRNVPFFNMLVLKNLTKTLRKPYKELKSKGEKYFGTLSLGQPVLVLLDLKLVKHILSVDFQHFNTRGAYVNEKDDPLGAHLFSLSGNTWRKLRIKLTPTFTSGKMKMMFQTLRDCGNIMENYLIKNIDEEKCMDIKELSSCFTTDVIGSIAFGLDCNSFEENMSVFRQYGKKVFASSFQEHIKRNFGFMFPNLARFLRIKNTDPDVAKFFMDVVKDIVSYREKNNYTRKDFIQLLIDLKNNKLQKEQSQETHNSTTISFNEVAAQAFVFFIAGFETSSTTMSFCLYELAVNQDIQEKVRDEINKVLEDNDGILTYEAVNEMKYLGQVIDETLRKYPPGAILVRKCVKEYKLPDSNLIVEKGVTMLIPVYHMHNDPEYFPEPEMFDPERFSDENKSKIPPFAYLPFGEGPRICIGLRFGILQAKVGLIALLSKFRFTLNEKTPEKLHFDPISFVLSFKEIVYMNVSKIHE